MNWNPYVVLISFGAGICFATWRLGAWGFSAWFLLLSITLLLARLLMVSNAKSRERLKPSKEVSMT